MTPDIPKGPEGQPLPEDVEDLRYELGRRREDCDRVREALVPILREHPLSKDDIGDDPDAWGQNLRAGYVARSAAEVLRWYALEVERLTAEVALLKEKQAAEARTVRAMMAGYEHIAEALGWSEAGSSSAIATAVSRLTEERDAWKQAAAIDAREHEAEVSRLREQLAAQTEQVERTRRAERRSIASVLTGMLEELETAYLGEFGEGSAPSRDKLRAVQAFSVDLFATSGPVELDEFESGVPSSEVEAPQPPEMAGHKVVIGPYGKDWWAAFCPQCVVVNYTRHQAEAEDWRDEHEADTLRPVGLTPEQAADELCRETQELFEGRPSGSERLVPRPVEAAVENALADALTDQYGFLPLGVRYTAAKAAREIVEQWLDSFTGAEDAAQAARSEATPRLRSCVEAWPDCEEGAYNPSCCRFPKSCSCTIYDAATIDPKHLESPSPSLPKEGEDRG